MGSSIDGCCGPRKTLTEIYDDEKKRIIEQENKETKKNVDEENKVTVSVEVVKDKWTFGMDELEKFEVSLPFDNMMIGGFFKIV